MAIPAEFFGHRELSDGSKLTTADVQSNDFVDTLAKQIARRDRVPNSQLAMVRRAGKRLKDIAMWIGRATAYANSFPDPAGSQRRLRDAQGNRRSRGAAARQAAVQLRGNPNTPPSSIWLHPRMVAVRQRILDKIAFQQSEPR